MSAGTVPHCPSGEEPMDSPLRKNKNQVKSDFLVSGAKDWTDCKTNFQAVDGPEILSFVVSLLIWSFHREKWT
jgi:hypothetical protein